MNFNKLNWHDSELLDIRINRETPGMRDEVILTISWGDGSQNLLVFTDCFALNLTMNFGVIAPESILDACMLKESEELVTIRKKWQNCDVNLSKLKLFQIETNSTNSLIQVFAMDFKIKS